DRLHQADRSGTTFSAACLQFDHAKSPPEVAVTVGHIGDTTVILCSSDGRAHALTADHNGHLESEKARIEALGGRVELKDGKLRVQGQLEPTRGIGDLAFKRVGVYAEPDLTALVKPAREVAFLCLVTDGVKQSMTHQEIVDVVKGHRTPAAAASTLIDVAGEPAYEESCRCSANPTAPGRGPER
ncbi:phosphatase 2C-like domain-containing protein, partial [Hyaloraphidium curvatum]